MPQLFDETELLERVGHDWEFLRETAVMLSTQSRPMMQELHRAVESGDANLLRSTAHTLKGMISNFCAHEVSASAAAVEKFGKSGETAAANDSVATLEAQLEELIAALNDWLAGQV